MKFHFLHIKIKMMHLYSITLDAIRTRYRIAKHRYDLFYKEKIQATLAACVYNEGTRKQKQTRQTTEMADADPSVKENTVWNQNGSSITFDLQ